MAKEQGITDDELGTAQSIVMAISGCNIRNKTEDGSILPKKQSKTFSDFYGSARDNEILSPKTTIKIQIAAALAFGCQI